MGKQYGAPSELTTSQRKIGAPADTGVPILNAAAVRKVCRVNTPPSLEVGSCFLNNNKTYYSMLCDKKLAAINSSSIAQSMPRKYFSGLGGRKLILNNKKRVIACFVDTINSWNKQLLFLSVAGEQAAAQ